MSRSFWTLCLWTVIWTTSFQQRGDVMLLVILSLVTHYCVIIYYHVIAEINSDECHALDEPVNISRRLVQLWPAIVPAEHYTLQKYFKSETRGDCFLGMAVFEPELLFLLFCP